MGEYSPTTTTWIIIGTGAAWLIWDVWLWKSDRKTISEIIGGGSKKFSAISFLLGYLLGHWTW